jgi:arylsulfatase A-like enzyme
MRSSRFHACYFMVILLMACSESPSESTTIGSNTAIDTQELTVIDTAVGDSTAVVPDVPIRFEDIQTADTAQPGPKDTGEDLNDILSPSDSEVPVDVTPATDAIDAIITPADPPRHVLLIILDDFGIDSSAAYGDYELDGTIDDGRTYASMPNMHDICASGIRFYNAWAAPVCSPTRGGILTGRYGFRYGIGGPVTNANALSADEFTLPELLDGVNNDIAHANFGKWHLGTTNQNGGLSAPNIAGWDHYAGKPGGSLNDFYSWPRTVDGVESTVNTYATTQNVDDAIEWLSQQSPNAPWLVWMAFNAPHIPFHLPPTELHNHGELPNTPEDIQNNPLPYYRATLEAVDKEIGRLLGWVETNGHGPADVIIIGDNGTFKQVIEPPFKKPHSKGTVFEGGVHVPMCISGPVVADAGRDSYALVQTVDLFSTIGELFGADIVEATEGLTIDSVSLSDILSNTSNAVRNWMYTEVFGMTTPNAKDAIAARNSQYKLIREQQPNDTIAEKFYDLQIDPHESNNLINAMTANEYQAYDELSAVLDNLSSQAL